MTLGVRFLWTGDAAEGARLLDEICAVAPVILDDAGVKPYAAIDSVHADPVDPMPVVDLAMLLTEFTAETAERLLEVAGVGSGSPQVMVEVRQLGGAYAREGQHPSAFAHRAAGFSVLVVGMAPDPAVRPHMERLFAALAGGTPAASGRTSGRRTTLRRRGGRTTRRPSRAWWPSPARTTRTACCRPRSTRAPSADGRTRTAGASDVGRGRPSSVGVAGFEPTTSSSRTQRATKLRYTPMEPGKSSRGRWARRPPLQAVRSGDQRQQRRLGRAGEPDRRVRRGAQPGGHVQQRPRPRPVARPVDRQPLGLPRGAGRSWSPAPRSRARTAARRGCGRRGSARSRPPPSGPAPGGTARAPHPARGPRSVSAGPATSAYRSLLMCGSSAPTTSISRRSALMRVRALFRSSQPAEVSPSRRSPHGSRRALQRSARRSGSR